jgi:acyl-CoA thioesterase
MTDIDLQQPDGLNHFGDLIGLEFTKLEDGSSHCQLEVNESHLNPHHVVHGAVVYSLADTGMGGALFSSLDPGQRCATLEIKISYLHFATSGTLSCESRVVQKSRRFGFTESEVFSDERRIAKATGTFAILSGLRKREGQEK